MQVANVSSFWAVWLPLFVIAVLWYGYNSGGFIGDWLQGLIDPLLKLGSSILNFIFGV